MIFNQCNFDTSKSNKFPTFNGSTKTIVPIALDEIVIEGKRNEKECFTAIGTSTRNDLKKLIFLTKGKEKSCSKYFTNDEMKKQKKKNKKNK